MIAPPDISYRSYRVWQRNRDTFLRLWKTEAWPPFIEGLVTLVALGFGLGSYVALGGQDYIAFLAPGLIAQSVMLSATFETTYGSFIRMDMQRTFDAMIATPLSIEDVIAGELLWAATRAVIAAVALLAVLPLFGLVGSPWALVVVPVAVLAGLMFAAFGMFFTALTPSINAYNYFFTLFVTPNLFFGAVFFPLDRVPEAMRAAVWFVPMSHVAGLFRALNRGELGLDLMADVGWMASAVLVFGYLSIVLMRRRLVK